MFEDIGLECDEKGLSTILFEIRIGIWSPYFKKWRLSEIRIEILIPYFNKWRLFEIKKSRFKDKMLLLQTELKFV